jgi:alpha-ribazole phosphatase
VQLRTIPEFAEQHLGEWQGQERKAFYAARKVGTHTLWFAPASERPQGGESFEDLMQRVVPAIERLNTEHRGQDIVAVTHGGTIRAAVGFALGLPAQASLSFSVENCSLTRLDHLPAGGGDGLWRVVSVNHRPWSRTPAADHFEQTPIGIDKA